MLKIPHGLKKTAVICVLKNGNKFLLRYLYTVKKSLLLFIIFRFGGQLTAFESGITIHLPSLKT